ncbi:MAG: hypothetical protein LBE12_07845 [Planctomycetaceae bacterium]|jgi:hypothetical protein|nr:hypothetical protein [Planctomycetaceae bacterium]
MPKQFEHQQSDNQPMSVFHFNTWIGLGLIICLLISGYCWDKCTMGAKNYGGHNNQTDVGGN